MQPNGDYKADYEVMVKEMNISESGSMAGHVYYSPAAGMGGILVTTVSDTTWQEGVSEYALLAQATSPTTFNIMMTNAYGISLTFSKQ